MTDNKKKADSKEGATFLGLFDKNADPEDIVAAIRAAVEAKKNKQEPSKKRPGQEAD